MPKRQVFYSFHYDNDVFRVQQIRNIGEIEGNASVSKNDWEQIQRTSNGIAKWINDNMYYRSCIVVLVGSETANRPWVKYEIRKAWNDGKGVVGIFIHNLRDPRTSSQFPLFGKSSQGINPFQQFILENGQRLSDYISCYNPSSDDAYNDIARNQSRIIDEAIAKRDSTNLKIR